MRQTGQGILPKSEIYFSSTSQKAKELFYCATCAGHFFCEDGYMVKRESYDSFLVLYVADGSLSFLNKDGTELCAVKGDTVIIDCYSPHCYFTNDYLESVWVHITGGNIRDFYNHIVKDCNGIIKAKNADNIKLSLLGIIEGIKPESTASEEELSFDIYKLLLSLIKPQGIIDNASDEHDDTIQNIKDYVATHLWDYITVTQLADMAHMSVTHFSRVFKSKCGFSPYDYVLRVRLNKAKELLLKSKKSITDIAYETGFNSEANFVYCFTKNEGMSPGKFRKSGF